jgi:transcriptional regulator with XRE-family HTH domain
LTPADLRAWREAHGLTQAAMAERCGIPRKTLEGLEQGRRPTSALFGPLAKLLEAWDAAA